LTATMGLGGKKKMQLWGKTLVSTLLTQQTEVNHTLSGELEKKKNWGSVQKFLGRERNTNRIRPRRKSGGVGTV